MGQIQRARQSQRTAREPRPRRKRTVLPRRHQRRPRIRQRRLLRRLGLHRHRRTALRARRPGPRARGLHRRRRGERPLRRRHIPPRGMGPRTALLKAERLVRAVRLREKNQRTARPRRRRRRLPPLVPGLQDFLGTKGKRTPPHHAASLSMSPQNAPVWGLPQGIVSISCRPVNFLYGASGREP